MVPATFLPLVFDTDLTHAELAYVLKAAVGGSDVGQSAQRNDVVEGQLLARQHFGGGSHADDGHMKHPDHIGAE